MGRIGGKRFRFDLGPFRCANIAKVFQTKKKYLEKEIIDLIIKYQLTDLLYQF